MEISRFIDWLKLSSVQLAALCLASGFIIFIPERAISQVGLGQLRNDHRVWIGLVFLFSSCLLLARLGSETWNWFAQRIRWHRTLKRRQARLRDLTPQERTALRRYIRDKTRTQYFQIEDGVIQGLEAVDVLYRSAQVGHLISGFAYNIQPWAWEYLNQHPELLSGPDVPLLGEGNEF